VFGVDPGVGDDVADVVGVAGPERVAADPVGVDAAGQGPPLDHPQGVGAAHSAGAQRARLTGGGAEERALAVVGDAGGADVLVEVFFGGVVDGHLVEFAALLVQAEPGAAALAGNCRGTWHALRASLIRMRDAKRYRGV
jgi:hypothetical protein